MGICFSRKKKKRILIHRCPQRYRRTRAGRTYISTSKKLSTGEELGRNLGGCVPRDFLLASTFNCRREGNIEHRFTAENFVCLSLCAGRMKSRPECFLFLTGGSHRDLSRCLTASLPLSTFDWNLRSRFFQIFCQLKFQVNSLRRLPRLRQLNGEHKVLAAGEILVDLVRINCFIRWNEKGRRRYNSSASRNIWNIH